MGHWHICRAEVGAGGMPGSCRLGKGLGVQPLTFGADDLRPVPPAVAPAPNGSHVPL